MLAPRGWHKSSDNNSHTFCMSKKELAVREETGLSTETTNPAGFDNISADDILTPRIKLYHPMSKSSVDAKIGDFYEVNENKNLGKELTFMLLGQKTVEYTNEDEKTGLPVTKTYKHLLIVPTETPETPAELILSAANILNVKKLTSALLGKSKATGNAPAYSFLVKATIETVQSDMGKYGRAQFEVTGEATAEQKAAADVLYHTFGKNYGHKVATPVEEVDTDEAFA